MPLGDSALVVELGNAIDPATNARVHALDRAVNDAHLPGARETVPAYASLLVHYDPFAADPQGLIAELAQLADSIAPSPTATDDGRRTIDIPVRYGDDDGPDLAELARRVGLPEEEVIRRHAAGEYAVAMLGFAPGFAYLMGLDATIACPRLDTPRIRVPAGSVAIAETQTGVYPYAMPGGWRLIGRTDVTLFDPSRDPPATLLPGDRVRFVPVGARSPASADQAHAAPPSSSPPAMRILDGGIQSTVQDAGRFGYERLGAPPSGAADPAALAAANRLVGNLPDVAAIEITAGGFEAELLRQTTFALAGAPLDAWVDGHEVPFGTAHQASSGERLRTGRPREGLRTYLAFRGGIDVPQVLGSRSTYLPAGFGGYEGRALRVGDEIPVGRAAGAPGAAGVRAPEWITIRPWVVRHELPFVPSGQWDRIPRTTRDAFLARRWTVSHRSDRMGLRLDGDPLPGAEIGRGFVSDATVTGAVQLSGDGLPIVLGVDRQTTGGYPKLGAVATVALHLLGQLAPGDEITFRAVSIDEAHAALRAGTAL